MFEVAALTPLSNTIPTPQLTAVNAEISLGPNSSLPPDLDGMFPPPNLKGIYELNGDSLVYCVAPSGTARPKSFTVAKGSNHSLIRLERFSTGESEIEKAIRTLRGNVEKDSIGWITTAYVRGCTDELAKNLATLSKLKVLTLRHPNMSDDGYRSIVYFC